MNHDSYAQLLGAFVGALHGESLLKQLWQDTVHHRLKLDYGEDWEEWTNLLVRLRGLAGQQQLVKID